MVYVRDSNTDRVLYDSIKHANPQAKKYYTNK